MWWSRSAVPRETLRNPRRLILGCTSVTVSASMPLTTRKTCHTAGTSAYQTFRVTVVRRPSDGTYSRPNTRTGLRPSFASRHKGVHNTVPKHRSPQNRARTRARRHRSDSPPLRTLTQTMLEIHTQAFTRCISTLPCSCVGVARCTSGRSCTEMSLQRRSRA